MKRKVIGHCVQCGREITASDQHYAKYPGWCATCRWEKENNMTTTNGVSDDSARAQIATTNARKARDEHDALNASAMAQAKEFDSLLDRLVGTLAPALALALRERRESYHKAVVAERRRARSVGEESREAEIGVKRYARDFRAPLSQLEPLSEYSLSVPNDLDVDRSLIETDAIRYLDNGAAPRPMRAGR